MKKVQSEEDENQIEGYLSTRYKKTKLTNR